MVRNIIGCAESGKKKQYKHGERFMLTLSEVRELIGIISKEENYMDGLYAAIAASYDGILINIIDSKNSETDVFEE